MMLPMKRRSPRRRPPCNSQGMRMRNKHRHKEVNQGIVQVLAILHAGLWLIFFMPKMGHTKLNKPL